MTALIKKRGPSLGSPQLRYVHLNTGGEAYHFNQLTGDLTPSLIKWDEIQVKTNPVRKFLNVFSVFKKSSKESVCRSCICPDTAEKTPETHFRQAAGTML